MFTKIKKSFKRVKKDTDYLKDWVYYLHRENQILRTKIELLEKRVR